MGLVYFHGKRYLSSLEEPELYAPEEMPALAHQRRGFRVPAGMLDCGRCGVMSPSEGGTAKAFADGILL
jgi:hypothetical protein